MATMNKSGAFFPSSLSGEHVGALAMSEAGAGSDVVSMTTRADRRGDRYILNGAKMWITNAPRADVLLVYAKTDPKAGARGITAFVIEKGMRGFSVARSSTSSACAAPTPRNSSSRIARCPKTMSSASVGRGVKVLMSGLDYERTILAAGPLGIMQAALDRCCPTSTSASSSASPLASSSSCRPKSRICM